MQALAEAGVIYLSKRRPALSDLWFRSKAVWGHDPERHRDLAIHRIPAAVGRRASSVGRALDFIAPLSECAGWAH
jgi:hypothetical protein